MTQFIESFFDTNQPGFKLWNKKQNEMAINSEDKIYESSMLKMNRKTNKLNERYFVLTHQNLFYLKSFKNQKIRGIMDNQWVRVEYILEESEKQKRFTIRFIKNMKYCDFFLQDES
jgi:hypothetical protein